MNSKGRRIVHLTKKKLDNYIIFLIVKTKGRMNKSDAERYILEFDLERTNGSLTLALARHIYYDENLYDKILKQKFEDDAFITFNIFEFVFEEYNDDIWYSRYSLFS